MIRSMTGFGQGQGQAAGASFKVEIKSVNNRFREIIVKGPRWLMPLEEKIKGVVADQVARGRVEVFVRLEGAAPWQRPAVDLKLAQDYLDALENLKKSLNLPGQPDLALLAGFREIIGLSEEYVEAESLWPALEAALEQALAGLLNMRTAEGERLASDLSLRSKIIGDLVAKIAQAAPQESRAAAQRLKERLGVLVGQEVDPQRLAQEVAFLADKLDVTEELTRLKSHLSQFQGYLASGGPQGRKLGFLVQEIHRELNTIGAKSAEAAAAQWVVEAKAELEKIREQIQNLE